MVTTLNFRRPTVSSMLVVFAMIAAVFALAFPPALNAQATPVLTHWEIVTAGDDDSGGDYVSSPAAGMNYTLKLFVEGAQPNDQVKWSLARNVQVDCFYSQIFGVADQTSFFHAWDVQVRHDAARTICSIAAAQVNYVLNGTDGTVEVPTLTFYVNDPATGTIALLQESAPEPGKVAQFRISYHSNIGPVVWGNTYLNLLCSSGFAMKDFFVDTTEEATVDAVGDFGAMMPPVADSCTWAGKTEFNGNLLLIPPFRFDVVAPPSPAAWQISLTATPSVVAGNNITYTAQITQPTLLPGDVEFRAILTLGGVHKSELAFNTPLVGTTGPVDTDHRVLAVVVQTRPLFPADQAWTEVTRKQLTITVLTSRVYAPMMNR